MGWKASMIVVNSGEQIDTNKLFDALGYYALQSVDTQPFELVMNPEDDRIYVGQYKGNTIICMQDLPLESMDPTMSQAEKVLTTQFPNSDIATFVLHSVVNLWGYSVVRNGEKLRARAGSTEGTIVEYGEMLEEEKELFSMAKKNVNGERVFVYEDMPEEEFGDDQVGENFVFDLSTKYFGESLDGCEELFETQFQGYTFSRVKPQVEKEAPTVAPQPIPTQNGQSIPAQQQPVTAPSAPKKKKPWWKFW